ncbi:TonB-dependent receptor [Candidatus Reidiella endopervernicosa]|uniref:TonB-dependent receptor n=1 Tax=Candidatus Reidiella endopervernicosa TaxID=2738883 RepID=A0A6N0I0F2_9GAMM|nr:TonB-dependent receptor [Candidatus Reidiella endopervernicosa]
MVVGPGVAGALDNTGYTEVDSYAFDIEYGKTLGDNFEYHARYAFQYQDQFTHFELFPPGAAMPIGADGNIDFATPVGMVSFPDGIIGNPGGEERRHLLDLDFIYTGLTNHRFRFGVGASDVSIETDETKNFGPGIIDGTQPVVDGTLTDVTDTAYVFMPDTNRQLWYLLAQDEWQLANDWALTAGVRYDHYSDFGSTTNPRLALVWATSYNLTSKLLYGRAFRAPAFSETQYINNPSILGNSDLDPETIDTLELAFDYRPSFNSRMAINFYAYNSEDLIDTVADVGTGTSTYQNTETQTGHGLELELDWQPTARVSLDLNYAWQHSEDENGDEIPDAPGQQISAAAQWQFIDAATLRMQTNWVGDRQRNPADTRSDIDDYLLTDLSLRIAPASMPFELALTGYNIFDEDAREPSSDALATPVTTHSKSSE